VWSPLLLWRLRDCAKLIERAAVEDNPHHVFIYAWWIIRRVEEVLYEDLWRATEPLD